MTIGLCSSGGFEIAYRAGTSDEAVLAHSFENDIFLTGVPEYRPLAHHTILDVGAHIGTFSLLASSVADRVFAVEACLESYNLCRINVALNKLQERITASHLALSDRQGECTLHHAEGNWSHTITGPCKGSSEQVPSATLTHYLDMRDISQCHFLKMNCEGAEFPILLSSPASTLRRFEVMLILYHCDLYRIATDRNLLHHLKSCGFSTRIRNRTQDRGWIIAVRK